MSTIHGLTGEVLTETVLYAENLTRCNTGQADIELDDASAAAEAAERAGGVRDHALDPAAVDDATAWFEAVGVHTSHLPLYRSRVYLPPLVGVVFYLVGVCILD